MSRSAAAAYLELSRERRRLAGLGWPRGGLNEGCEELAAIVETAPVRTVADLWAKAKWILDSAPYTGGIVSEVLADTLVEGLEQLVDGVVLPLNSRDDDRGEDHAPRL